MKIGESLLAINGAFAVAPRVWGFKSLFVNIYFVQNLENDKWVMVDTGLKLSVARIKKTAQLLFGENSKPEAIILTHGHFDHINALETLTKTWDVPVFAHFMEVPYLTGKSAYPPADPTVGGGLMSLFSLLFPNSSINIWNRLNILPADGSVPHLDGWRFIHTPGHTPGHISLFREEDKVLISGDAFVTTKPESLLSILLQTRRISGPPKYLTYDWDLAARSVRQLADLRPKIAASGHGKPIFGTVLSDSLLELSQHFESNAVPARGRYVNDPAIADTNGVLYIPIPVKRISNKLIVAIAAVSAIATFLLARRKVNRRRQNEYLLDFEYNF